jgi:hypothetical protein
MVDWINCPLPLEGGYKGIIVQNKVIVHMRKTKKAPSI